MARKAGSASRSRRRSRKYERRAASSAKVRPRQVTGMETGLSCRTSLVKGSWEYALSVMLVVVENQCGKAGHP